MPTIPDVVPDGVSLPKLPDISNIVPSLPDVVPQIPDVVPFMIDAVSVAPF